MSLNDEERRAVVRLQIEKAHAIFDQIPLLCEAGYWDNVVNRLYYSLFHAVSALLINDGYNVGSHRGAVGAFGQYYVTKGAFLLSKMEGTTLVCKDCVRRLTIIAPSMPRRKTQLQR